MNKIFYVLILISIPNKSLSQDDFLTMVNNTLDEYETTIKKQSSEIRTLRTDINNLVAREKYNEKKLTEKIMQLEIANLKLAEKEYKLNKLRESVGYSQVENNQLKIKIGALSQKITAAEGSKEKYKQELSKVLKETNKQQLLYNAQNSANLKYAVGKYKKNKKQPKSKKKTPSESKMLLFFNTAYKYNLNEPTTLSKNYSLHLIPGFTTNKKDNIFIGVGVGYETYRDDLEYSALPVYLSAKASLIDNSFIYGGDGWKKSDGRTINKYIVLYAMGQVGYSFFGSNNNNRLEHMGGGWFSNSGIGAVFPTGGNTSIVIETSYWTTWGQDLFGTYSYFDEYIYKNAVDIRLGLNFYIK